SGERYAGINIGMLAMFVQQMVLGVILVLLGGMMIVLIVSRLDTYRGLTPIFVLALALLVFSFTGAVGDIDGEEAAAAD
ncbi:hypothetical protein ACC710_37715, partial [Rhizobium ruizarguesonis]